MQSTDQPTTGHPPQPSPGATEASTAESTSGGLHLTEKIKGAVHVVHGATERLRGSIIGSWDNMVGKEEGEVSGISSKGKEEYERGMEALRPGHHAKTEQTGGQPGAGPAPQAAAATGAAKTQEQVDTKAGRGAAEAEPQLQGEAQFRQEGGMQPGPGPQQPATALEAGAPPPPPRVAQSAPVGIAAAQEMEGKQGPIGYDVSEQRAPSGGVGEGGEGRVGPP